MSEGVSAESLSAISLFLRADWVVKSVMLGLLGLSLWSWAVILDRGFRFSKLNKQADAFEAQVNSGRSLEDIAAQAGAEPAHPLPRMLVLALKEWRDGRGRGALSDAQSELLLNRIDRGLDSLIAREQRRIEEGLGTLAVVATASPFIGLFGTVWGIMHAFQAIATAQNTSLAVVAPAIAEALFATAIGLAAAIPAYMAYNKFTVDAAKFTGRLEGFADDLIGSVARRLGDRMGGERQAHVERI